MFSPILDNSETYLRIFTNNIEIDYSLPKYNVVLKKIEEKESSVSPASPYSDDVHPVKEDYDSWEKRKALLASKSDKLFDKEFFDSLTADDLTLIIDEERSQGIHRRFLDMWESDMKDHWFEANYVVPNNHPIVAQISNGITYDNVVLDGVKKDMENKSGFWARLLGRKKTLNQSFEDNIKKADATKAKEEKKSEPTFEWDVFSFFNAVKLASDQETVDYYNRVGAYLAALKKAKQMGQQALIDGWVSRIFVSKYESLLRVKGFHHKITEQQMVHFVKKTEKGVALNYIKNFAHPIPDEVVKKKLEADELHVFDNYLILHYDPKGKVYAKTEKEHEIERAKRTDPILFGIIAESRDLYYIADWVDQYCDLTLDRFLEVSGLDKKSLEIGEKIQL